MPSTSTDADVARRFRKARRWTQTEAERWWFGRDNGGRTWRRYESGAVKLPFALKRAIAKYRAGE